DAGDRELVTLPDVATVERGADLRAVPDPAGSVGTQNGERVGKAGGGAGSGPGAHELAATRGRQEPEGRERPGAGWHDHDRHVERVRDRASVERARAAERHKPAG